MKRWLLSLMALIALSGCSAPDDEPFAANPPGDSKERLQATEEIACEKASKSFVREFNDNLRPSTQPFKAMFATQSPDYPGGPSRLFLDRPAWFVAGDYIDGQSAVWATGRNPVGGKEDGLTVPLTAAARRAATIGIDVPRNTITPLLSDPAFTKLMSCLS